MLKAHMHEVRRKYLNAKKHKNRTEIISICMMFSDEPFCYNLFASLKHLYIAIKIAGCYSLSIK